ncbi:MAG: TlpA disulfide reductase family protein [Candidatus Kapaibacterium sp.]
MKRLYLILGILFCVSFALHSEEEMKYISGKITLGDGGAAKREVYVYYNRFQYSDDNLMKIVPTDANGEFKVPIPYSINYASIHLAAPGYAAYMTDFIEGDTNPRVEAILYNRAIPEKFDSIGVLIYTSKGRIMERIKVGYSRFVKLKVDFKDKKYSSITNKGEDTVRYALYFKESSNTPAEHNGKWKYDNNGDYYAVAVTKKKILSLSIDLSKYRYSDDPEEQSLTSGGWVNSPVNMQYNEVVQLLPLTDVARLRQNFYYYVMQYNNEAIKKLDSAELEKRKMGTIMKFRRYISTNDSLLRLVESPYLKDYLNLTKMDLLSAPDSLKSWKDKYEIMQSLQMLPTVFYSEFNDVINTKEFKEDPQLYLDLLEALFAKSKNTRNNYYLRYGLYSRLAKNEIVKEPNYRDYLIKNLKELAEFDDLDSWPKTGIPKTLAQLELDTMSYAPDFSFKTIDGKELRLSDYKGKWVLLDFWGTWCGPCVMETPFLVEAYNTLGGKKFEMISIANDRSVEVVSEYVKKNEMKWTNTVALEGYAKGVLEQYGITSYPTMILIDPMGKFIDVKAHELRGESLLPTLESMVGKE